MKMEEFVEKYDGAPIDLEGLAHAALKVEDDDLFVYHARKLIESIEQFESMVTQRDIELG